MEETEGKKTNSIINKVLDIFIFYVLSPFLIYMFLGYFSIKADYVTTLDEEGGVHAVMFGFILGIAVFWSYKAISKILGFVLFHVKARWSL